MLQLHVSRNLPAAMGAVILLTALLCVQICTAQQMPSYFQKFAVAKAFLSSSAEESSVAEQFLEDFSVLWSPTRFQEELLNGIDSFMSGNNTAGIENVSELCFNQTRHVLVGLARRESWAFTFLDIIGKPSPNLKGFNFVWPGAYKECFNLTVNDSNSLMQAEFKGQYCTASLTLSEVIPFAVVSEGLCVPSSCSSEDVTLLLQALARSWKKEKQVSATCQEQSKPLNRYAIAGVVVCSLFAALMVIGTLIDIVTIQMPKWRSQEMDSLGINSVFENVAEEEKPLLLGFKTGIATPEPGLVVQILVSFSVYTNGSKLLSTTQSHNNLACLHGIRFFSMTWVVLGHTFITPLGAASNFYNYYLEVRNRWSFLAISNAMFSVDTFFVLSGLLVTFLSLKEMKRCAGRLNWGVFYLHRFWRLTPPYMLILLLYVCLGPYWGGGPMWPDKQPDRDNCKTSWWTNLLYINNFVDLDESCMGFTWYLANDMQFYILSPLIFVPFYYSVKYGVITYGIFLTATVVTPACLTVADHLPASLFTAGTEGSVEEYQHELYIKPYTRMGPYIVGMVTGYLLYYCNCRIQINKTLNLCGWMVATAVALAVVYGLYDNFEGHSLSLSVSAFYNALSRIAWGVCVAWVIFSCVTGNGGFVNTILSWKALVPLSRLTYLVYLVHIIIMEAYFYSRDTPFYISDENVVIAFLGLLLFSFMVAAVISIACEAPMMALEKVFLKTLKRRE